MCKGGIVNISDKGRWRRSCKEAKKCADGWSYRRGECYVVTSIWKKKCVCARLGHFYVFISKKTSLSSCFWVILSLVTVRLRTEQTCKIAQPFSVLLPVSQEETVFSKTPKQACACKSCMMLQRKHGSADLRSHAHLCKIISTVLYRVGTRINISYMYKYHLYLHYFSYIH